VTWLRTCKTCRPFDSTWIDYLARRFLALPHVKSSGAMFAMPCTRREFGAKHGGVQRVVARSPTREGGITHARTARESHVLVTRPGGLHASFDRIKHAVIHSGSAGRGGAANTLACWRKEATLPRLGGRSSAYSDELETFRSDAAAIHRGWMVGWSSDR
jgi:hypothetical protein